MKRVSRSEVEGMGSGETGFSGSELIRVLSKFEEIRTVQAKIEGDISNIWNRLNEMEEMTAKVPEILKDVEKLWSRLNKMEDAVAKGEQYQKDHDELHRNMAAADKDDGLADAIMNSTQMTASQMQQQISALTATVEALQQALSGGRERKDVSKKFKIERGQNGLIAAVVETS